MPLQWAILAQIMDYDKLKAFRLHYKQNGAFTFLARTFLAS